MTKMKIRVTDPRRKAVADLSDSLSGDSPRSFWTKWFGGIGVPFFAAAVGVRYCILKQAVLVGSQGSSLDLHGHDAIAMGIAWLSAAFFLHFHYFWGNLDRLSVFSDPGKIISAIVLIGSLGYVCRSILMS